MFPLSIMTWWDSWKKSSDYVGEYGEDIVQYARILTDDVKTVEIFKTETPL